MDAAGNVYVIDDGNNRVLKLAAGSTTPIVLPFTGLNSRSGVAVDTAGNVYVTDNSNNRVLKLAAGSRTPVVLPFTGLTALGGVAVDTAGDLYVTDSTTTGCWNWRRGRTPRSCCRSPASTTPWVWRWTPPATSTSADFSNNRVLKLAAGSNTPTVLPFTGLNSPKGVAVDTAGNVYVIDVATTGCSNWRRGRPPR